jgi:hypothetical protein
MIKSNTLEKFIEDIVQATEDGHVLSSNIQAVNLSPSARLSSFYIVMMDNAKTYEVKSINSLVAQIVQFTKDERRIRSVTPISISKRRIMAATYIVGFIKKVEPVQVKELIQEDLVELPEEVQDVVEAPESAVEAVVEGTPTVDTPEVLIPVVDVTEAPTATEDLYGLDIEVNKKHPLTSKSKKALLAMVQERKLAGNSQQSKRTLIKAIVTYEKGLL